MGSHTRAKLVSAPRGPIIGRLVMPKLYKSHVRRFVSLYFEVVRETKTWMFDLGMN